MALLASLPDAARLAAWAFVAFWLWLGLVMPLRRLRLPAPQVLAATLGWIGAGLALPWSFPLLAHWARFLAHLCTFPAC